MTETKRRYGLATATLVAMLWLSCLANGLPLAADEAATLERIDALAGWQTRGSFAEQLRRHWRFSRALPDPHGPVSCLVSYLGFTLTSSVLTPPLCYRIGPIALFALAAGSVFTRLRQTWGLWPAGVAVGLLIANPRIIPDVCYAMTDGTQLSLYLLGWVFFVRSLESHQLFFRIAFGVVFGLALATKFTGCLLIVPYLAWSVTRWDKRAIATCTVGIVVGMATLWLVNPGWWFEPVTALKEYIAANLDRANRFPVPTQYFGAVYPFALPWHNTLAWTVLATPAVTLLLGTVGVAAACRRWSAEPATALLALNWLVFIVVRAMPTAPGHDGVRLMLVSMGCFALLAAYGLKLITQQKGRWTKAIAVAAIAEAVIATVVHHPLELSYYSPLVGGLPGAVRLGFEPTYQWAAVTPDVLGWLNEHTPANEWVFVGHVSSFDYLAKWGQLCAKHRQRPGLPIRPRWVLVEHRPGVATPYYLWLYSNGHPAYSKLLFGIPLVSVYSADEVTKAIQQTESDGAKL